MSNEEKDKRDESMDEFLKVGPGEALLAIKIRLSCQGGGTMVDQTMRTTTCKAEEVRNITQAFLTLQARGVIDAISERIKTVLNDGNIHREALTKVEDGFGDFLKLKSRKEATDGV